MHPLVASQKPWSLERYSLLVPKVLVSCRCGSVTRAIALHHTLSLDILHPPEKGGQLPSRRELHTVDAQANLDGGLLIKRLPCVKH